MSEPHGLNSGCQQACCFLRLLRELLFPCPLSILGLPEFTSLWVLRPSSKPVVVTSALVSPLVLPPLSPTGVYATHLDSPGCPSHHQVGYLADFVAIFLPHTVTEHLHIVSSHILHHPVFTVGKILVSLDPSFQTLQ